MSGGLGGAAARVASNGNIDLSGAARIHGDATPGPGMRVTGDTSLVAGSSAPAAGTSRLTPFVYKPPIAATRVHNGSGTFETGVYRFAAFRVPDDAIVTFRGDVKLYVDGDFSITCGGQAILTSTGTLEIFHASGDFTLSGQGILTEAQRPRNLRVFSATTGSVKIMSATLVHAAVYAPHADGTIHGAGGFHGSFQANTLTLSGGAQVHYDVQLDAMAERFTPGVVREER
jgi:hypothetical protein